MMAMDIVTRLVLIAIVLCALDVGAAPYQHLEPRPGYVPVYIRLGDTPLKDIYPGLAEAFHETDTGSLSLEIPDTKRSLRAVKPEVTGESSEPAVSKAQNEKDKVKTKEEENKETDIASFDVVKGEATAFAADGHKPE